MYTSSVRRGGWTGSLDLLIGYSSFSAKHGCVGFEAVQKFLLKIVFLPEKLLLKLSFATSYFSSNIY